MSNPSNKAVNKQELPPGLTFAPAAMAMGVTMTAWGILTHWTISATGVVLFAWALYSWMGEVCRGWGKRDER